MNTIIYRCCVYVVIVVVIFYGCTSKKMESWQPANGNLFTIWSENVSPQSAWTQYPRPQMVRDEWLNLNGLWECALVSKDSFPAAFQYKILVPFPVESALSGVMKRVGLDFKIWYKREIKIPENWKGYSCLMHFEAVDWQTTIWIDGLEIGSHKGGYDPFSFDVTEFVNDGLPHELMVGVWDPTDDGYQPRGKQVSKPQGIFYTPSSGIWQTVWMEPVFKSHFKEFTIVTDIDRSKIIINPTIEYPNTGDNIIIEVTNDKNLQLSKSFQYGQSIEMEILDPILWSPENPFLYDLKLSLIRGDQVVDEVKSYFGMRKISLQKDENGFNRIALNNVIVFQNGSLDQGFWPDGLYTPPADEAMRYDIEITKKLGFNMLRKHVKIENRRFYYWCDKLGMMVWQDMPNAEGYVAPGEEDLNPSNDHKDQFEHELEQMIITHINHPSIVMWVPFNEGWGQYDTERIVDLVYHLDSTRLVNNASGWQDRGVGDVIDVHHYPNPMCPNPEDNRASVLGEFGGLGFFVENHSWQNENWGYEEIQSPDDLLIRYEEFYKEVIHFKDVNGLAASVYTQTTDVETETNGLMTYDRALVKMEAENLRNAHHGIFPPSLTSVFTEFIESYEIEFVSNDPEAIVYYTIDGKEPDGDSKVFKEIIGTSESMVLKAKYIWPDGIQSRVVTYELKKTVPLKSINADVHPGLKWCLYEGNWEKLPDFDQLNSLKNGITAQIDISISDKGKLFGIVFEGFLNVPETDVYLLYLSSDDGGRIYMDERQIIDYDGIHGAGERKATIALEKGLHPFKLIYFQRYGGLGLKVSWESPKTAKSEIESKYWYHN